MSSGFVRDVMRSINAGLLSGIHRVSYTYIIKQYFFCDVKKIFLPQAQCPRQKECFMHFFGRLCCIFPSCAS